ncbi:hypothetical protein QQ045_023824 [Rhodiola kirilowii]
MIGVGEEAQFEIGIVVPKTSSNDEDLSVDGVERLGQNNQLPWLVLGDFNEVLFDWEVWGGRIRKEWQMRNFREAINECGLMDLGYSGLPFTFSNRGAGILETRARLDRTFGNMLWKDQFKRCDVSDLSLGEKLVNCSHELQRWNRVVFGKVQNRIKAIKKEIKQVKAEFRSEELIEKEAELHGELDEWLAREELLCRQRSRIEWLKEGDSNTTFFHTRASQRRRKNTVSKIKGKDGYWITVDADLCGEAVCHFMDILSSSTVRCQPDFEENLECIRKQNF